MSIHRQCWNRIRKRKESCLTKTGRAIDNGYETYRETLSLSSGKVNIFIYSAAQPTQCFDNKKKTYKDKHGILQKTKSF